MRPHWTEVCYVLQVDVTSKTEGKAFADSKGVPLLVKYDTRLRQAQAKDVTEDVSEAVEVLVNHQN